MIILDTHADTLYRRSRHPRETLDVTVEKLNRGGVSVQTMALFVGGSPALPDIADAFEGMWRESENLPKEGLKQVTDYRDAKDGESAFIFSVEGCDLLEGHPELLSDWRKKGVRMAALTWNYKNCIGTPAKLNADEHLTPFGRDAVKDMVRLGIAPDTSHLNERGFYDLLEMGIVPLASHSCCKALCGHSRNLTDEQLKALFAAGGYVGLNFYPWFLSDDGKCTLDTLCDHIIHMLELGGEGMIGFGSDFDGIEEKVPGLDNPLDVPALIKALERRGVTGAILEGISGKNLLRYYDRFDPR